LNDYWRDKSKLKKEVRENNAVVSFKWQIPMRKKGHGLYANPCAKRIVRRQFVTTNCACRLNRFRWQGNCNRFALDSFLNPKSNEEIKNSYIKFRCTKKERIEGMAERSGVTLSEYCRQQCLIGRILASPKLSPTEISYFRELKEHNNTITRLANLVRNTDPQLVIAIEEYIEQSRQLYNRFF
jgi:hypothetical protein